MAYAQFCHENVSARPGAKVGVKFLGGQPASFALARGLGSAVSSPTGSGWIFGRQRFLCILSALDGVSCCIIWRFLRCQLGGGFWPLYSPFSTPLKWLKKNGIKENERVESSTYDIVCRYCSDVSRIDIGRWRWYTLWMYPDNFRLEDTDYERNLSLLYTQQHDQPINSALCVTH